MRLLSIMLSMLAALALVAGCTDNAKLQTLLTKTCGNLQGVLAHYDAVAAEGAVSAATMRKVEFARAQADKVCASPETATTLTITGAAASVYVAVRAAFREGGALSDARVGYSKLENLRGVLERARSQQ